MSGLALFEKSAREKAAGCLIVSASLPYPEQTPALSAQSGSLLRPNGTQNSNSSLKEDIDMYL